MGRVGARVLRVSNMPGRVTMWVDHQPQWDVVYVDAEELTEHQAQLLEAALNADSVTLNDLLGTVER